MKKKNQLEETETKPAGVFEDGGEVTEFATPEDWEAQRQKMIDLSYQNASLDPASAKEAFKPPKWAEKKYSGMEFSWIPSHPLDITTYLTPAKGWMPVDSLPSMKSEDGKVHRGDTVLAMRPTEVGQLARAIEDRERDRVHGAMTGAGQVLEEIVNDYNYRKGRELLRIGSDSFSTPEASPHEVAKMNADDEEFSGAEMQSPAKREGPPKYVSGFGPSKRFGGNK